MATAIRKFGDCVDLKDVLADTTSCDTIIAGQQFCCGHHLKWDDVILQLKNTLGVKSVLAKGFTREFFLAAQRGGLQLLLRVNEIDEDLAPLYEKLGGIQKHHDISCVDVSKPVPTVTNAVGRSIPLFIPGYGLAPPFAGVKKGAVRFPGKAALLPNRTTPFDQKMCTTMEEALTKAGLKDGMTLSFHHHLRNGDYVVNAAVAAAHSLGVKNLTIAPSALFPIHAKLLPYLEDGTVQNVLGSLNGPIGKHASEGNMAGTAVLRSHGGRIGAIGTGELHIDIAVLGASSCDKFGNCNGLYGKSAFGPMAYGVVDSLLADKVIIMTDNLVEHPCQPIHIPQCQVDHVLHVDCIGDPSSIVSGTTVVKDVEPNTTIGKLAAQCAWHGGALYPGCNLQAGAGGISLASMKYMADIIEREQIVVGGVVGGHTSAGSIRLKDKGLCRVLLDGQVFDMQALDSMRSDPVKHVPFNHGPWADPRLADPHVVHQDCCVLGATEVDVNFNVNVNTHSDGYLLHGIGGHQDAALSKMTIITCPTARKTNAIILDAVTTVTTPGESIDIIVTEEGCAVNPLRKDLSEKLIAAGLPVKTIQELRQIALQKAGQDKLPVLCSDEKIIGLIEYRDGTVIDVVYEVDAKATQARKEALIKTKTEAK